MNFLTSIRKAGTILTAICILHTYSLNCVAQSNLRPLKIGDKVPEQIWKTIPKKKTTELVILDFWSTYCTACIAAFPKMENLQSQFNNKLQIVLINTWETKAEMENRFSRMNSRRSKDKWFKIPVSLPALNDTSIFQRMFPHLALPHHVWLDKTGKVIAITDGEKASAGNVRNALNEGKIAIPYKVDFFNDKPLYLGEEQNINLSEFQQWSLFKKGKINGVPSITDGVRDRGIAMRNVSIARMFRTCQMRLYSTQLADENRILFDVSDYDKLDWKPAWDSTKSSEERDKWEQQNFYTYDLVIPEKEKIADEKAVYKQMLYDINRFSDYVGGIEKRKIKCFVLIRTSQHDKLKTKGVTGNRTFGSGPYSITNADWSVFLGELFNHQKLRESFTSPFVDETNYTGKIDISFEKFPSTINELKRELQSYDLDLIEAEREIEMFVVKDKIVGNNEK